MSNDRKQPYTSVHAKRWGATFLSVLLGTVAFVMLFPEVPRAVHPVHVVQAACVTIHGSNANGSITIPCTSSICRDPDSGLIVNYTTWYNFEWTQSGANHYFNVETIDNTGPQYCGPADSPTADGYATDGSGFRIHVQAYHDAYVYNPAGVPVYP